MKVQFSPSKLSCYQHCARQYYFQYIKKYPRRVWANQSFGNSLHRTLQGIYEAGGLDGMSEEEASMRLKQAWISAGYADADAEALALERGQALLASFREWSHEEGNPVFLEKRMTAQYRDVLFLGIVDRLDRRTDNSLEVVEYKSGLAPAQIPPAVLQQVMIYQHLISHKLGEVPTRLSIHYLGSNQRFTIAPTQEECEAVLDRARDTAIAIQNEEDYLPNLGEHCEWCDYRRPCQSML